MTTMSVTLPVELWAHISQYVCAVRQLNRDTIVTYLQRIDEIRCGVRV